MPHQILVTVRAPLKPGRGPETSTLLDTVRKAVEQDGSPFVDLPGVHFARLFVLPGDPELDIPDSLVYLGEIDAPQEQHLQAVATDGTLSALFAQCVGYPVDAGQSQQIRWVRRHLVNTTAHYVHSVGRSVEQVRDEAYLRSAIEAFLDDPPPGAPAEVHRAVRRFVADRPDLAWALQPSEAPGLVFRLSELLHAVAVPAVLLPLAPVLLPGAAVGLLLIRLQEARDLPATARPTAEHVAALTAGEDHGVANPFTAFGRVKPGLLRRITIGVALQGLDYACRHVFNRDNLAGVRSIHFARWVLIDGGRRVIFASDYDGSQESYMDDFIDLIAWGVNLVFSNGEGYPPTQWLIKDGAHHTELYKRYLRRHQVPSVWFAAYPDISARNLDDNARLRAGLASELNDEEAQSWLALL